MAKDELRAQIEALAELFAGAPALTELDWTETRGPRRLVFRNGHVVEFRGTDLSERTLYKQVLCSLVPLVIAMRLSPTWLDEYRRLCRVACE